MRDSASRNQDLHFVTVDSLRYFDESILVFMLMKYTIIFKVVI